MNEYLDNVIIFENYRLARDAFFDFVHTYADKIDDVKYRPTPYIVTMKNGKRWIYMSKSTYPKWCLEKTYILDGNVYRNGKLLKEVRKFSNKDAIAYLKRSLALANTDSIDEVEVSRTAINALEAVDAIKGIINAMC